METRAKKMLGRNFQRSLYSEGQARAHLPTRSSGNHSPWPRRCTAASLATMESKQAHNHTYRVTRGGRPSAVERTVSSMLDYFSLI